MVEILEGVHSIDCSEEQDHSRELWILSCHEGVVLIDTGMGEETLGKIEAELASIGKNWKDVDVILITHRHGDHTRNLKKVKELTNASVKAQRDEVSDIENQTGVKLDGLDHGDVLPYCGGIEVIHVPGHTAGNCCYYLPRKKIMIAGDTIFGDKEANIFPPPERYCLDVDEATREIERLLSYDFDVLLYTHGKDVMESAKEKVKDIVNKHSV